MGLKIPKPWLMKAVGGERVDWRAARERIDLAAVATALLGPAPGRRGARGRRLWWHCPFHEDANPSFCVEPGKAWWRCYGCDEHGDAATLVMKLRGVGFPEALAYLAGGPLPAGRPAPRPAAGPRKAPRPDAGPSWSGMEPPAAVAVVEAAAARLWGPEGAAALAYLTGPRRGLAPETIRSARLGLTPPLDLPGRPRGVVIPWFRGPALTLVKIRQPRPRQPKYHEAFRDRERLVGLYPGPEAIRPGRPLVVTEGEFDALLLGQELGELAGVVTLGSASARPGPELLGPMLAAAPWYIATDADEAGDKAAGAWPPSARRIRPPSPFKDWTEAKAGGIDLRRWWGAVLAGDPHEDTTRAESLAAAYARGNAALEGDDPAYAEDRAERDAIRWERGASPSAGGDDARVAG